jgi:hypothetical protein
MFKLSFAAALLYGANAIASDAKNQQEENIKNLFGDDATQDILNVLAIPSDERISQVNAYWVEQNNERCQELFNQLITIRKDINVKIGEYSDVHDEYETNCKLNIDLIILLNRRVR